MTSIQEQAHHGDVTLQVDVHDGLVEYVLVIDHTLPVDAGKVRITDQQARDAGHCFADLLPYSYALYLQQTVGNERAADNGDPQATMPADVDGYRMCEQCGQRFALPESKYCTEECERNDRVSEHRGWSR